MRKEAGAKVYSELLEQIDNDCAVLFLGAGSTRNCRDPTGKKGLTGDELAREILNLLDPDAAGSIRASLTEVAEYYVANKAAARPGLDQFIQRRLSGLQPTVGHYLAAAFNWRAVITTNYNAVVESAWSAAHAGGFAARSILPIRVDGDLDLDAGAAQGVPLYKPHGCITIQEQQQHRMIITSQDYFASDRIRPRIYARIRSLAETSTTLFIGYSMADYTFRNIYYELYATHGDWTMRSFSVSPVASEKQFEWMATNFDSFFKTTLIHDSFDTFMLRLTLARGRLHPVLKELVESRWTEIEADSAPWMDGLELPAFLALPG